jgi:polysaccharide export outer membrane protein
MTMSVSFRSALVGALLAGVLWGCGTTATVPPAALVAQVESDSRSRQQLQHQLLTAGAVAPQSRRDYEVGPEDLLEVVVFGQDNLNRTVRVTGDGKISLPLVGDVQVAGQTPQAIEKRLAAAFGSQYLRNPQITVSVKEFRHQRVAITGAVDKPGAYEMIGPRTLLEMLALAGGLQDKPGAAKAGDVVHIIRRQDPREDRGTPPPFSPRAETIVVDLKRLLSGETSLNLPIRHGDVIHVPFAGNAYVLGGVRRPGSVTVKDNLTVSQAVALAGGLDPVLGTSRVSVTRRDDKGNAIQLAADLKRILNRQEEDIPLKDNDVVVVGESALRKGLFIFKELLPGTYSGAYRFAN